MDEPKLPLVSAYHAEIHVQKGEKMVTLEIDLPDWSPEEHVVRGLAKKYKVTTMGGIVEALEKEGKVRVEPVGASGFYCHGDRHWWHMSDKV